MIQELRQIGDHIQQILNIFGKMSQKEQSIVKQMFINMSIKADGSDSKKTKTKQESNESNKEIKAKMENSKQAAGDENNAKTPKAAGLQKIKREKHKKVDGKYNCKYCEYSANSTNTLSMHCRTHHSDKPEWKNLKHTIYKCKDCNETFSYKVNYLDHVHKKHKKIKKQCPYCPKQISMNGVYAHCYKKHATEIQKKDNNLSEYKLGKLIFERGISQNQVVSSVLL